MSRNQAFCYFCSKPDDSIQVICLSRCLVCSRCQLVPAMRKLLLDHCEIVPISSLHNGVANTVGISSITPNNSMSSKSKGTNKFADGYMSSTMNQIVRETSTNTILYLPSGFVNNVNAINGASANTTLLNSSNMLDDAINTLRQSMSSNNILNATGQMCMRGNCPICGVNISVGMLQIILEYKEAQKAQAEDEASGKSSANFELEETSALIPNFLKRYRATYEAAKEKDSPPLDPSDPFSILNSITISNNSTGNSYSSKEGSGSKKNNSNPALVDPMEVLNVPPKQTLQTILEFLIDCYCGQLQNMLKNGNDSMLTVMMRQAVRKKFSQKTNDYKIKSLIDYMTSTSGSENSELILFCHLIGLQPKPTIKLSAGWSHIATTILACALCDKSPGRNGTAQDAISASPIPTTIEFRSKMTKYLAANGNLARCVGAKRATKLINILFSIRQPYWVMAPVTSQCIEYQCRMPWCRESMSKLFNILLFVMLYTDPVQPLNPTTPGTVNPISAGTPHPLTAANSTRMSISRAPSRDAMPTGSATPSQGLSRRNTGVSTTEGNTSIGGSAVSRSGVLDTVASSAGSSRGDKPSRRQSTADSTFWKAMFTGSTFANGNTTGVGKSGSRMDMLKSLDPVIDKIWNSYAHPFLKIPRPAASMSHYEALMINPYQTLLDFFATLDDSVHSSTSISDCFYIDCDEEQFLRLAESVSLTISIHELSLVLIRCWEAEYSSVRQALVKSIITSQRRTGIVGSYDAKQASMTATERLAITRLLHFYRQEDESNKQEMIPNQQQKSKPKPIFGLGNRPNYPGLYQFRGIDWDEVEVNIHRKYYPFSIPLTLLGKSRVELNTLSEQVTELILVQQIKDIEDDIAWKARIAKEEEDSKLPDIAELYHESTPLDSEEESDEESRQFIADFMKEGQKSENPPSLAQAKANFRRLKAASRSNTNDTVDDRRPLLNEKVALELGGNLPSNQDRENFQKEKGSMTAGGFIKGAMSPSRPLSAAATAAEHASSQSRPSSSYPKQARDTIYHTRDGQVSIVEIMDNDGEVLEKSHLLSRPKSGVMPTSRQHHPMDKVCSYPSGVDPQPLEVIIKELPVPDSHKVPLSVSGRRSTPLHDVRIEKDREGQANKIYVDDEVFHNPTHNKPMSDGAGNILSSSQSKKSLVEVEDEIYRKSLEDFKRAKIMEARSKILNRANSMMIHPENCHHSEESNKIIANGSRVDDMKSNNKSNTTLVDEEEDYRQYFNSADVLGAFGRATTAGSSAYHKRHRIEPYLNLAKHINRDGQLVLERENNLIIESAIQYLTLQNANMTLQTLQEVCQIFFKDWQMEYIRVLDLSGNPLLSTIGVKLICSQLKKTCHLLHLNLNHMNIGDAGLKLLLKSMSQGGGEQKLLRLELQKNQLTFASDAISMLCNFKKLKALDLSGNYFTLDTNIQMKYFENGIKDLKDLTLMSVAYNKIQDRGFGHVIDVISRNQLPIKALDVAGCFLTNKSGALIHKVLRACPRLVLPHELEVVAAIATPPPLPHGNSHISNKQNGTLQKVAEEPAVDDQPGAIVLGIEKLFLHQNLFGVAMWETILVEYQPGSSCRIQHKDPYIGIAAIPCYHLRDYGIIAPNIHSFA